jgi:hypothetical protein
MCVYVTLFKAELNLPQRAWLKSVAARSLYSTGTTSYMQTRGPTGGPGLVDTLL